MGPIVRSSFLSVCLLVAPVARAEFHTFQIEQLFTNADGSVQFIVLHETQGMNGENLLSGHAITASNGGAAATYVFPNNLPGGSCGYYGCSASPTANARVLIGTQGFAALGIVAPDFVVPNAFLPLTMGTVNYAGVDQVSYTALPTDGASALNRNGVTIASVATNFHGQSAAVNAPAPGIQQAVEYYYAAWNFYFMTSFPAEIAALDGGAFGGVWQRTGKTFDVWSTQAASPLGMPACRFFSTAFAPKSSHFYTPFPVECAQVMQENTWQFEAVAFFVALADGNGMCPAGTIPLYRAYDNGMGGAPNHRYTTSLDVLNQMIAQGWAFEGSADTKVFACVPP